MTYKVGQKVRSRRTGELFLIIRKDKRGYDVTDDYTEFGTFSEKEFKKDFKPYEEKEKKEDTPRVKYLKEGIAYLEKLEKEPNLEGYRPYTAVKMQKEVYQAELNRALKGEKPMYETPEYAQLDNSANEKNKK